MTAQRLVALWAVVFFGLLAAAVTIAFIVWLIGYISDHQDTLWIPVIILVSVIVASLAVALEVLLPDKPEEPK